jgi:hypothetical protein
MSQSTKWLASTGFEASGTPTTIGAGLRMRTMPLESDADIHDNKGLS